MIKVVFVVAFFFVVVVLADPSEVRPSVVGVVGPVAFVVGAPGWTGVTSTVVVVPNEISEVTGAIGFDVEALGTGGGVVTLGTGGVGATVVEAPTMGTDIGTEAVALGVVVDEAAVGGHGNA